MAYEITDGGKVVVHNLQGNVEVKEASARVEVKTAIVQGGGGGGGNDFIVTISWNDSTQLWEPDCTVYEWQDACEGGKTIAIECSDGSAVNWYSDDDYVFAYTVYSWDGNNLKESYYIFTVDGVEHDGDTETIVPAFDSPTRTYTPTTSQQTETITFDSSTYNGIQQVGVTVNAMPTGTAGTPTATKGSVSNHAVSVTPSVTNATGYITGGTKTGTAVSVSASELVSGSETKTANGTYDVTNLAELVVNVSGGGGANIDTKTLTNSTNTVTSLSFSSMKGTPKVFFLRCATQMQSSSTTYYYVSNMRYNGTNTQGNAFRMGSTRQVTVVTSGYSYSYSNSTLTVSSSGSRTTAPGSFYNGTYELVYVY